MSGRRHRPVLTGAFLSSALVRWTQPSFVRSVQRGTIAHADNSATATATITAVALANSFHSYLSYTSTDTANGFGDAIGKHIGRLDLTNTTTVTSNFAALAAGATQTVSYEVMEFVTGVLQNSQSGNVSIAGTATSATATITSVDTTKSILMQTGWENAISWATGGGVGFSQQVSKLVLTNATTITITQNGAASSPTPKMNYAIASWN